MKKIKFILPLVALGFFGCADYHDVNTSPNSPNALLVTPNLSMAGAQTQPYRALARTGNIMGNLFMNNWGFNVNSFAVTNPEEFSLDINNNTFSGIWDGLYLNTVHLSNIINHPSDEYDNHKAIAKILKSFYFQYLVDLYGDIPYFEAHKGTANLTPAYDDDEAVYRDLVVQIEEAIAMIENPVPGTRAVGAEDVTFNGAMQRWVEFGNTVKLRLLLRQSELASASQYLTDEFAELQGATFLSSNAVINPGYSNNTDQQQPYFDMFYLVGTGTLASRETGIFRQYRASDDFAEALNSNPTSDTRKGRLFALIGGSVVGVLQGDTSQNQGGTAPLSISSLGPGQLVASEQDGYVMTLTESLLLQAEAVHRGYMAGDAQSLFDAAVASSFAQLGAAPGTYISDVNGVPGKGYGIGSDEDKLRAIMYQKRVALTGINAMEVFIEYTRTGFIDDIPLALGAVKPNKPRRLFYPNSEVVGNPGNVPDQDINQVITTGPFWFVNN